MPQTVSRRPNALAWYVLFLLAAIWGSSFLLIKLSLSPKDNPAAGFPPAQMASLRLFIAGVVLFPILPKALRSMSRKQLIASVAFGACNAGIPAFLFAFAQQHVNSSIAGILNALTPMFNYIIGIAFFGVMFFRRKLLGVIIGLLGAVIIMLSVSFSNRNGIGRFDLSMLPYLLLILCATVFYGCSGNIMAKYLSDVKGIYVSVVSYFAFGLPAILISLFTTDLPNRIMHPDAGLLYVSLLGVFGSAVAIILFSLLVKNSNALFATFVTYLIPAVSITWGMIFGENVPFAAIIGLLVILSGIIISATTGKTKASIKTT